MNKIIIQLTTFLIIATLFLVSSCKKDDVTPPRKNYVLADIEGDNFAKAPYKAVAYEILSDTDYIYITSNSGGYFMSLTFDVDIAEGTYSAQNDPFGFSCGPYPISNQNNYYVPVLDGSFTITTKDTEEKWLEGTFNTSAYHATLFDTIRITDGEFGVFY